MGFKEKEEELVGTVKRYGRKVKDLGNALTGRSEVKKIRKYLKDSTRKMR